MMTILPVVDVNQLAFIYVHGDSESTYNSLPTSWLRYRILPDQTHSPIIRIQCLFTECLVIFVLS